MCTWALRAKQARSVPWLQLGASLRACPGVYLRTYLECTWYHLVSWLGSVYSSRLGATWRAIGSVVESVLGSVIKSFLRAGVGVYSQAGWVCSIQYRWESPWEHAQEGSSDRTQRCIWECSQSVLGSVLRVYIGLYSQAGWVCAFECNWESPWEHAQECTWERTRSVLWSVSRVYLRAYIKQAGIMPPSAIRSVPESMHGSVLENVPSVYLGASCELTWERIVKQAGSVSSSAIGSVLESVLESMLEIVLRAYLGAYSHAGWECAIECNCERPWEHAWECTWECTRCRYERTRTVLGSVLRVYLGAYSQAGWECFIECNWELRACSGVCLSASWELPWEHTVKLAGSVPSSAIGSVLESMP